MVFLQNLTIFAKLYSMLIINQGPNKPRAALGSPRAALAKSALLNILEICKGK